MANLHSWIEHTGELELAIEADTELGVFAEAAAALGELIGAHEDGGAGGEGIVVDVAASAGDRPALLAEWLSELAFLAETEGFVPHRVVAGRLWASGIEADVEGCRAAPPHLVKAVTYHRLEMKSVGGSWRGHVVLDV